MYLQNTPIFHRTLPRKSGGYCRIKDQNIQLRCVLDLKVKLLTSSKKIRTLQQKLRRNDKKIETLSGVISDLKAKSLISADASNVLEQSFSGNFVKL